VQFNVMNQKHILLHSYQNQPNAQPVARRKFLPVWVTPQAASQFFSGRRRHRTLLHRSAAQE
jgi:hypothetical protein